MHPSRLILLALLLFVPASAEAAPVGAWSHQPPASSGWSPEELAEAKTFSGRHNVTALMVVQHGSVVAEWGDTAKPTELASIRKSLLSALIGIAVSRYQIDTSATLDRLGIDDKPSPLTGEEKQATVKMLLEARSGIYHPALYETRAMAEKRPPRLSHAPGTFWYYNNWDFNALGTIYETATGTGIYQAFDDLIARKIGMQDYDPRSQQYVRGRASIHPAYTFRMSARDLARFALLFLDGGRWNGQQVVPPDWVKESTIPYSQADHGFGYAYLWWTADIPNSTPISAANPTPNPVENLLRLPAGSYFAWGHGGQFAFVIPGEDLVIVIRTDRDLHLQAPSLPDIATLLGLVRSAGHSG